ncbi:MAG: extracellular solute-binding protein [Spirochaetales bacterium]|nr:extracellular solute-binding protein [Spirochaetales bacterium]
MNKLCLKLFFLIFSVFLYAENFTFTSRALSDLTQSRTVDQSSVSHESRWYRGASLLEIFPLMEDVYRFEIVTEGESFIQEEDDLAEYWAESYLVEERGNLSLIFKDELYRDINEIRFSGTRMESRSLEVWLSWEGIRELKAEINRFARHHNLEIKTVEVPNPESKLISIVRARGEVPDLVMLQSSGVENLVLSRSVQNIDYIELPDLIDSGLKAFTLNGKLWGVPFYFDTQVMFFNKRLITRPPVGVWTLEEMESIARSINNRNTYPLVWNAYSSNWLIPFQMAFGKDSLLDSREKITVNDTPTEKALEYLINLQSEGLLTPMERDAMDALFIAGKVGMIMSGSYSIPYYESLGLDFGVLPFPMNQETGRNLAPLLDFKAFCMTRQTRAPLLARRLLQYLAAPGVQQRFCPPLAKLPARRDVLGIPGLPYGYLNILEETVDTGEVTPPQHIYSIYKNNMWKLLRFALSGKMTVQETLEQGQTLMDNTTGN